MMRRCYARLHSGLHAVAGAGTDIQDDPRTASVGVDRPGGNVLNLAEGEEIELPIPVADNLIAQGVVVAVEEGE